MTDDRQAKQDKEKRTRSREMLVTRVTYEVLSHSKGVTLTQNISEGGLCLILARELPAGAHLEVKIDVPGKEAQPVEIFAEVVWQKKTEMGWLTGLKLRPSS